MSFRPDILVQEQIGSLIQITCVPKIEKRRGKLK